MTTNSQPDDRSPSRGRPAMVTESATVMTIAGAMVMVAGLVSLFARGPSAAGLEDVLHWAFIVFPPILLPVGVLDLVAARGVLRGAQWARVAGLVAAVLLAVFGLFVLGANASAGELLLSTAWIVANGFVIYALSISGPWFAKA